MFLIMFTPYVGIPMFFSQNMLVRMKLPTINSTNKKIRLDLKSYDSYESMVLKQAVLTYVFFDI